MHNTPWSRLEAMMALLSPAARQGTGPLARLMREGGLHCVFQPLADLREGQVYAHEALIRGPQNTPLHTPDKLLELARHEGILQDFELLCVYTAMEQWGRHDAPGRLFVNISADALVHGVQLIGATELGNTVRSLGLSARMLVLEITEHERVTDMPQLRQAIKAVHACGARLALDDFGDGRSSLRLWSEVKPDFVKIDKYFIRDISDHPENLQMLQAIKGIADVFGTQLIAEGIETRDDLRALRDLDIPLGQGWLLGRPAMAPREAVDDAALEVMHDRRVAVLPHLGQTARPGILRSLLVVQAPTAAPATNNDAVAALFRQHTDLHALAVVDGSRPVALINRQQFMNHYATPYFREVHGRKSCLAFANLAPRVVELDCDVDQLVGILTSQDQRYLSDGYIVTDNGRYLGLGTGDQLVRAVTETRIEAAPRQPADLFARQHPHQPAHPALAGKRYRVCGLLCGPEQLQALQRPLRLLARRPDDPPGGAPGHGPLRRTQRLRGPCGRRRLHADLPEQQLAAALQEHRGRVRTRGRHAVRRQRTAGRRHPCRGPAWRAALLSVHHAGHRCRAHHARALSARRRSGQPGRRGQA